MRLRVPAGHAAAGPWWRAWLLLLPWVRWPWEKLDAAWQREWTWTLTFDASWRYQLPERDQRDANKLFGATAGCWDRHRDSARFGAYYEPRTDRVHVVRYSYVNGRRIWHQSAWQTIHTQAIDVPRRMTLRLTARRWEWRVFTPDGQQIGFTCLDHGLTPRQLRWGWGLGHFFGGDRKAPQEIKTRFERS